MSDVPSRAALRAALAPGCLRPSVLRSLGSLARDLAGLAVLYTLSSRLDSHWGVPLFAFAQGTLFWALFVLGHDCGHGSFAKRRWVNDLFGHLLHTPLLVPYHAWRISHRLHHRYASHVERDVVWVPLTQAQLEALPPLSRWLRLRAFLLAFPLYLLRGTPGRAYGSHYDPRCSLFQPSERRRVATSVLLCGLWLLALVSLEAWQGQAFVLRHWALPWLVFCAWAALVTYLHHTDPGVAWYRDEAWTPLRGALATVDRSYGLFEAVHHHAGSHTAHHLFPGIPHHQLRRATTALRPMLAGALRESREPIWRALLTSARACQVVAPSGAVVRFARLCGTAESPGRDAASSPATR